MIHPKAPKNIKVLDLEGFDMNQTNRQIGILLK